MLVRTSRLAIKCILLSMSTVIFIACGSMAINEKTLDVNQLSYAQPTVASEATSAVFPNILDGADAIVAAHESVMANVYQSLLPSVVRVEVANRVNTDRFGAENYTDDFIQRGEGSGFVWSSEGHIVTNHHVVDEADRVIVVFEDGSEYDAEILGSDPDSDLAVLMVNSPDQTLKPAKLGDSSSLSVGQFAVAIGAPFGQSFSMTRGIVSGLERLISGATGMYKNPQIIQTDAPINPGNSGGPLLDREGNVIGVNSQIISNSGSSSGVGFAVPINTAKLVVPELIRHGKFEYPYLGISGITLRSRLNEVEGLPSSTRGVLVISVVDQGPADFAGINGGKDVVIVEGVEFPIGGDVIKAIDGVQVQTMSDLITYLLENNRPGDTVTLTVLRGGDELTEVDVELTARNKPQKIQRS